eukprot:12563400-Prorocentrum_lima.AAC.1
MFASRIRESKQSSVDLLALSQTRWTGASACPSWHLDCRVAQPRLPVPRLERPTSGFAGAPIR